MTPFVGEFSLSVKPREGIPRVVWEELGLAPLSYSVAGLLGEDERLQMVQQLSRAEWTPVGVNGMKKDYVPGEAVGSLRASTYSPKIADMLWQRLRGVLGGVHNMQNVPTDALGASWEAIGLNPLLRFIRYPEEGVLVGHYDAPYIQDEEVRTLLSVVVYLHRDCSTQGGRTRFLVDSQAHLPVEERDLSDWNRSATEDEVLQCVEPPLGGGVIFPHRVLHDGERVLAGEKWLMRTDVEYRRVR